MPGENQGRAVRTFRAFVSIVPVLVLATQVWAQEVSPVLMRAAAEAYQQAKQQRSEIRPPISPTQKSLQGVSPSDWDALYQLQVGDRVVCRTRDGISHRGRFRAVSSESITLQIGKREVGFRREQVASVRRRGRGHRGKVALLGAAVGFGIAVLIGAAANDEPVGYLVGGLVIGGVGAGIGAAAGWPRGTTIYRVNP